jgi:DNA-binding NarL/FixJ family response regulator
LSRSGTPAGEWTPGARVCATACLQATTRITGAHPHIRVVVYSVFDTDETQQAARQAGAAAFVAKHGPPDQVPAAVLATWQATGTTPTPPTASPTDRP